MEVFEIINHYLREKKISKKEFAARLQALEPKLKSTGEIPSEKTIYAYLNGRISIKAELIPYIAQVLDIPEQLLFADCKISRKKFLLHILKSITPEEKNLIKSKLCNNQINKKEINKFDKIEELLQYAPDIFIKKLENILKEYKALTLKFKS
ncbi:hypothetical protein RZR97_03960 [Hydrogenimonas thermophila]|uniref:hypothetical protein n=1 Tax=Hydrogenimonas thermophila TaxID=223786 RepID=UPI0029373455|nr:hypothetical protein [Hydrogenimonas thermophila]WOE70732.1 hypothetical protein RZR91_03975 [Hydrogenimonas thermophila]WOE73250.1 hypothetical protein RZR97_03960 [Hydrogenimonas thermophila]